MQAIDTTLPIKEVLTELLLNLQQQHSVVLQAPPGAGKTTIVPLAIIQQQNADPEGWLNDQRILMLEPRRMAARTVAQRMANLLEEPIGQSIGYRVRQDSNVSKHTRVEVITEGVLLRMLLNDPSLPGIGLLIFDEFHERSLDMDIGLALALQSNELFRDEDKPLKLLVMSATLNGDAVSSLLNNAPIISSAGRSYPVTTHYSKASKKDDDTVERVVASILQVHKHHQGSILVFLPGQGEINRVKNRLLQEPEINDYSLVLPLYGALPYDQQKLAIQPLTQLDYSKHGKTTSNPWNRKIVLSTDIAETSLTIEGITIVIDSGLHREASFDKTTAMTRLKTKRISKDSSEQRKGRAGRTAPGNCYRLWSEEQQQRLAKHSSPEILQADLSSLTLQLLAWGVDDIDELNWLDTPPLSSISQALELLEQLGAIEYVNNSQATNKYKLLTNWRLSDHGNMILTMPTHPRLAHMLISSIEVSQEDNAALLAALLTERNSLNRDISRDIAEQLKWINTEQNSPSRTKKLPSTLMKQAQTFRKNIKNTASKIHRKKTPSLSINNIAYLIACAYPDRIAKRKDDNHQLYQLSNGRMAFIDNHDPLCGNQWLAVAELSDGYNNRGIVNSDRIISATGFTEELLKGHFSELISKTNYYQWDEKTDRFVAEQHHHIGKLKIESTVIEQIPSEAKNNSLIALIRKKGLQLLPWKLADRQWQARVMLLRQLDLTDNKSSWPDVSDQQLLSTLEDWLLPYLDNVTRLSDFKRLNMNNILSNHLSWLLQKKLTELTPTTIKVPSGSAVQIDYLENPPILKVKLQEMFGCESTPSVANGQVKLMLHLLSPAQRPLQITQDLAGFWKSSYFDVRKEMKGRYPKHPWPEDPMNAIASKHSKRRINVSE